MTRTEYCRNYKIIQECNHRKLLVITQATEYTVQYVFYFNFGESLVIAHKNLIVIHRFTTAGAYLSYCRREAIFLPPSFVTVHETLIKPLLES